MLLSRLCVAFLIIGPAGAQVDSSPCSTCSWVRDALLSWPVTSIDGNGLLACGRPRHIIFCLFRCIRLVLEGQWWTQTDMSTVISAFEDQLSYAHLYLPAQMPGYVVVVFGVKCSDCLL